MHTDWESTIGGARLDLMVDELRRLVAADRGTRRAEASRTSHPRRGDEARERAGRVEARTRDLVARSATAPVAVADVIPAVMMPQWHRGHPHRRSMRPVALYDEVADPRGGGRAGRRRVRLMWVGRGLWCDMGFYRCFEDSTAPSSSGRCTWRSPRTAMSATATTRCARSPPVFVATSRADLRASLVELRGISRRRGAPGGRRRAPRRRRDTRGGVHPRAFEGAGIPVLEIAANNVDQRAWDDAAIKTQVSQFIESRLL